MSLIYFRLTQGTAKILTGTHRGYEKHVNSTPFVLASVFQDARQPQLRPFRLHVPLDMMPQRCLCSDLHAWARGWECRYNQVTDLTRGVILQYPSGPV